MDLSNQDFAKIHCDRIRELDPLIRFVGIANAMGTLLGTSHRKQLQPLLNEDETRLYSMQAVLRAELREDFQKNMGTLIYSVGKYDKLLRATVPMVGANGQKYYVLISLDVDADAFNILEKKILPYIDLLKEEPQT
ncbi:MAG: hypothetical protein AB7U98_13150 [Candidatus Nitrosocosmicus sp.]|uniref:hypothetical protein n=1 Tax=Candidatus Nitrosocosmicus sp. FF01 TaxID=3397670 RepID=UPI002A7277BB|nr:hypothetical protein [Candidatus Nitrosocosmicus sp.]GKS61376.1 hypothetical protein YTPLAS21_08340 [Candidatus Nitrosocosmicus sp.]